MRASRYFLATLKEAPSDAELVSHKLMVRAGLIRRLAGGIYTWMPLGLRVVRKVEAIVREEMNRAGAIELFMPAAIGSCPCISTRSRPSSATRSGRASASCAGASSR